MSVNPWLKSRSTVSRAPTLSQQPTGHTAAGTAIAASLAVTGLLPNRTTPPDPGDTAPFGQRELAAIKAGSGCWVWSGVLNAWLFWVRDEERKARAISRGIDAGCIWTLPELTGVQGMPPEGLRDIVALKRQFSGTIQRGAVPAQWRNVMNPLEPTVEPLPVSVVSLPDRADRQEAYLERCAILEYEADMSWEQAERKAGTCYYCRHWRGTRSGKGYCCIGFAPPVQRQANESCEHFAKGSHAVPF